MWASLLVEQIDKQFQCEYPDDSCNQSIHHSSNTDILSQSDIIQCDGGDSINSTTINYSEDSEYDTEDEVDNAPEPAVLIPAINQPAPGQPLVLEVDHTGTKNLPASIPLVMVTNFRSIYNKISNFRTFLKEVSPECTIASETWNYEGR